MVIQLDRPVYNVLIPTEVVFPSIVAENRDVVFSLLPLARKIRASKERLYSENSEKIVCGTNSIQPDRAGSRRIRCVCAVIGIACECREGLCLLMFVSIAWPRGGLRVSTRAFGFDRYNVFWS
jgi:hypothetical protein